MAIGRTNITGGMSSPPIKKVQRGMIKPTAALHTVTIENITPSKSAVVFDFMRAMTSSGAEIIPVPELYTNAIKINTMNFATDRMPYVSYEITEYDDVKSIQSGTISIGTSSTYGSATISEVDPSKCIVISYVKPTGSTYSFYEQTALPELTAKQIKFMRYNTRTSNIIVYYKIIEFN